MKRHALVLTCEHAGNLIPPTFQYLFKGADGELEAHTGWDPGSLEITRTLAEHFGVEYFSYEYTRLLIEVNRSEKHAQLYSKYSQKLMSQDKNFLLKTYYQPYRRKIEGVMRDFLEDNFIVVHLAVHTFTPIWEGKEREVEIGLLFDETREGEATFCRQWLQEIKSIDPIREVKMNEPYQGADDGFTTYLRTRFSDDEYLGLELEVSQKFVDSGFEAIKELVSKSLKNTFLRYPKPDHLPAG